MTGEGPVTLQGIAERLGLHVSTVSRVLNGPRDGSTRAASGDTARRIRNLADELGYRPNPLATGLRTRRSNLIGVLVPRLSEIVMATVYEGAEEAAAAHGLSAFVTNTYDDPSRQRDRIAMVLDRRVDGLVIGDAHLDGAALDLPALRGTPFVLVNRRTSAGHTSVTCDDRLGGRLVAEHLLALGHRSVGVIAGEPFASTGADRTEGFVERYREAGLPLPARRIVHSAFDTAGGRRAALGLLSAPEDRPTALFAVNDFAAIGAAGAARDLGMRLGQDLALAGFNDTPLAAELPVPLTSVHSPMAEQGRRAVNLLVRRMAGEDTESEVLAPCLRARESTGGPIGTPLS